MRIAVCYQVVEPKLGGAETFVVDLCRGLVDAGHEVDLLAERWDLTAVPAGVRTRRVATRGRGRLGSIWGFARGCEAALASQRLAPDCSIGFINTWGQDILIPQGGVRGASLDANAERFRSPLAQWAYRVGKRLNPKWWVYQEIERRQYDPERGSHLVAVSRMVRDHMAHYHGVQAGRVTVIPNAIDESRLTVPDAASIRKEIRDRLGCGEAAAVGLFVAHNFKLKGLDPLLRALALERSTHARSVPVHLAVCGGGDPAPFQPLARALGIADRVHFLGFLEDVRAGYHGADFLVLPSYYDPCSLVVFEALACGLPVITTRQNGAGELIADGCEGFVVARPDDIPLLARSLARMADPDDRRRMSGLARDLGHRQTFGAYMKRLLVLVERVAAERRGRRAAAPHARSSMVVASGTTKH